MLQITGQPRLTVWAQDKYAAVIAARIYQPLIGRFASGDYEYTLRPAALTGAPEQHLDDFFSIQRGLLQPLCHGDGNSAACRQYSANVVIGYQGGEWNSFGQYYRVRQSDAHAGGG